MPAISIWMQPERAQELRRMAMELSLERDRQVSLSALVREALEAQWPTEAAQASDTTKKSEEK